MEEGLYLHMQLHTPYAHACDHMHVRVSMHPRVHARADDVRLHVRGYMHVRIHLRVHDDEHVCARLRTCIHNRTCAGDNAR